jgi:diadenosine tetraphosphate (Ap4A) HIT family hydrolase
MGDCIFCKIVQGTEKSWKVYEKERGWAECNLEDASRMDGSV